MRARKPLSGDELVLALATRDIAKKIWRAANEIANEAQQQFELDPTSKSQALWQVAVRASHERYSELYDAEKALQL